MSEVTESNILKNRRSRVYQYFTFENSEAKWHCNFCAKKFTDSATSTLWRHMQNNHPVSLENRRASQIGTARSAQKRETFSESGFRKKLLRWIVVDDQPLVVVEGQEFQYMINYIRYDTAIPSADTLRRELENNFFITKQSLRQELQESPGLLSFSIDAWTSKNQIPFLGVSVHWIDHNWRLRCTTLDFSPLSGPHSGENLAKQFLDILQDFNIETKIMAIACDNASNMDTMLRAISDNLKEKNITFDPYNQRVRCLAHIIDLAAKKALKDLNASGPEAEECILEEVDEIEGDLKSVVYKLRKLVVKIRSSPQRRERFHQQCVAATLPALELIPDIKTRWNSTEMMLERALKLRQALHNLASSERDLKKYVLTDDEWDCIENIQKLMQYFKKATNFITAQLYPTLAYSVPVYNYILDKIEDEIAKGTTEYYIKTAARAAETKIKDYYPCTDGRVYVISTIIDPRLKMQYYEDKKWESFYIDQAKETITELWETAYKDKTQCIQETENDDDDLLGHFFSTRRNQRNDELSIYLKDPVVPSKTDVLLWWKLHEVQYPNLSKMARDYLAIPATSATVERIFSGGTDLVAQRRCSLQNETIRQFMCLKDWWKSGVGEQTDDDSM